MKNLNPFIDQHIKHCLPILVELIGEKKLAEEIYLKIMQVLSLKNSDEILFLSRLNNKKLFLYKQAFQKILNQTWKIAFELTSNQLKDSNFNNESFYSLDIRERWIFYMRHRMNLNIDMIADLLEKDSIEVTSLLSQARGDLRELI